MHAPSVGEGLQARPVVHALREAHPHWQFAYTFFSPSAERFASSIGADITDYLPFDRAADADALLDAIRPSVLAFAKLDVWPVLVGRAVARGVPVVLISATLSAGSGRRGWWSRQLVGDAYGSLAAVGAIDAEHAERLVDLGVQRRVLHVTGDTRFDQVHARAQLVDRASPLLTSLASKRATLVAGSTWPADEAVLLEAWSRLKKGDDASPRLIIAPHEPTQSHCGPIETWATRTSLHLVRLSQVEAGQSAEGADVVLVDKVGVLGDLYALADMAFVGGGFHSAGLHSVIEPAAFGVPVVFGPRHGMSREAGLLLAAGGAHASSDADSLQVFLGTWLADDARRRTEGAAALASCNVNSAQRRAPPS
jgi:3-deoxy-D-manno-octulosonic-acid transferase